jgi:hypothetical protein
VDIHFHRSLCGKNTVFSPHILNFSFSNNFEKNIKCIEIKTLKTAHDQFLILYRKEVYHIGASLKDLGKKWFAFSKLNEFLPTILDKLNDEEQLLG